MDEQTKWAIYDVVCEQFTALQYRLDITHVPYAESREIIGGLQALLNVMSGILELE